MSLGGYICLRHGKQNARSGSKLRTMGMNIP